MATKRPTEKNTKAEILAAYDELLKEKKAAQTQAKDPQPQPKVTLPPTQKDMDAIVESLGRLQINFGSAISELAEKLTLEAKKLLEIQQSVTDEMTQLATLHGLQLSETSLDQLIQQYGDSFKTFSEAYSQWQDALHQEITQAQKAWAKEQEEHRLTIKERNETLNKARQRDGKEYVYNLTLQRKLINDEYEHEQKYLHQELEELRHSLEKAWTEREKGIRDREVEFDE